MKQKLSLAIILLALYVQPVYAQTSSSWTESKARSWLEKKEWLQGLSLKPHASIDAVKFATQYQLNQAAWDKAFLFLKSTDLKSLTNGRHTIDSTNVYAIVSEAPTKDYDKTAFESHENYIDLQYVISGEEAMAKVPVNTVTVNRPYNPAADIAYYIGDGERFLVPAGSFTLFFPGEAHRPNITPGGNGVVKKIVIKIKAVNQ